MKIDFHILLDCCKLFCKTNRIF